MIQLKVICHDGKEHATEAESYNAQEIADKIADPSVTVIAVGDIVVHKTNISRIVKL